MRSCLNDSSQWLKPRIKAWKRGVAHLGKMAAASGLRKVTAVYVCSAVPNLASYLLKRLPHVEIINVPVGCSEGL